MIIIRNAVLLVALAILLPATGRTEQGELGRVEHIVVIYLENRSFDNLFGLFPGANGLTDAKNMPPQVDEYGLPYKMLPPIMDTTHKPAIPDKRFPTDLKWLH